MDSTNNLSKTESLLENKITTPTPMIIPIMLSDEMMHKIKYLNKAMPKNEWSGVLFYSVEGSIREPKEMKITLHDVYPMHKGSAAYTEYELDELLIGYRMDNPETLNMQIGHIHSHNVMGTFFSGTDVSELKDNVGNYNYYLSVITNNYLDFAARIAFNATPENYLMKDEDGEMFSVKFKASKQEFFYYECKVIKEVELIEVPDQFKDKVKWIIDEHKKAQQAAALKAKQVANQSFNKGSNIPIANQIANSIAKNNAFDVENDILNYQEYENQLEEFMIDLLEEHTPISLVMRNLDNALNILILNMNPDSYTEYVSSVIVSYPSVYERFFPYGKNDTEQDKVANFIEDLDAVISTLENSTFSDHPLVTYLTDGLTEFQTQFSNFLITT